MRPRDAGSQDASRAERVQALFDRGFYLASNPDVAACGLDPLRHYLEFGMREGRSPHPAFDPAFYAA